jgi:hypothetical protein
MSNATPAKDREFSAPEITLTFVSQIGSTCDLGAQTVCLAPGASTTCGGGNCSCSSCCSW